MIEPGSEQPGPSEGPDPWCTWCHFEPPDSDLPYRIKGEDDGRWPSAFCSLQCAARWGNAAHQDRIYHVEHGRGLRADGSGRPVPDLRSHLDEAIAEAHSNDRIAFASLTFAPEHVDAIRRGEKTVTLRLPGEYDDAVVHAAERGAEVLLETPDGEPFARATMCGRFEMTPVGIARLATLPGYPTALESADDVNRVLERHYGRELLDDATFVDVLQFDVTELLRRETVEVSDGAE